MLRPVEDIQLQTKQAAEDRVMRYIDDASRTDCKTEVRLFNDTVPEWLELKLRQSGYKTLREKDTCLILWGYGDD